LSVKKEEVRIAPSALSPASPPTPAIVRKSWTDTEREYLPRWDALCETEREKWRGHVKQEAPTATGFILEMTARNEWIREQLKNGGKS
jgi:hypothetical protein